MKSCDHEETEVSSPAGNHALTAPPPRSPGLVRTEELPLVALRISQSPRLTTLETQEPQRFKVLNVICAVIRAALSPRVKLISLVSDDARDPPTRSVKLCVGRALKLTKEDADHLRPLDT